MCSSFAFGAAFHEKKWEPETLTIQVEEDDPLGGGIKEQEQVAELLNITKMYSVNPSTVSEIRHTPDGSFDGFVQGFVAGRAITSPELNPSGWVKPVNALVYANDPEFGNMWGVSLLKAAYPYWFWKQVVLKLWMAWAEKKAQPTRIIRHPQGIDPLTNIDYRDLALIIANQIDSVSAVAMPNTREGSIAGERGDYMWTIDELTVTDRTDTFERVVKKLDQYMLWSIMVPERVFQEGQFGTRAEAVAQTDTFLLLEDARLRDMLDAYNQWVLEPWRLQNYGPGAAKATIAIGGLTDSQRTLVQQAFMVMLSNPENQSNIDFRDLAENLGIPTQEADEFDQGDQFGFEEEPAEEEPAPEDEGLEGETEEPEPAAEPGVPANLILDDAGEAILLASEYKKFDPSRWDVTSDPDAKLGFKVTDRRTGKRLGGFAAMQVIKAYFTYQQKEAERAQKKAESEAKRAQSKQESEAKQAAREQQRKAERAERKSESQAERQQRRTEQEQRQQERDQAREKKQGEREQKSEERRTQRDEERKSERAQTKAQRDKDKAERDKERVDQKAQKEQADLEKEKTAQATGEERGTLQAARGERIDMERQTGRAKDAAEAAAAIRQAGWQPLGGTQEDRTAAVQNASRAAETDPRSIYSVVRVPGGFAVVKKPKAALTPAGRPRNVAAEDDLDEQEAELLADEGYDSSEPDDEFNDLLDAAARRLGPILAPTVHLDDDWEDEDDAEPTNLDTVEPDADGG
jgi:hypothetical protein